MKDMNQEVSKDYLKYMNKDGIYNKDHTELIKSKEAKLIVYQTLTYENNEVRQLIKCTKQNCINCTAYNPNESLDSDYNKMGLCILHLTSLREGEYNK